MSKWRPLTEEEIKKGYVCECGTCSEKNKLASWCTHYEIGSPEFLCEQCLLDSGETKPMERPTCGAPLCAYWHEEGACRRYAPTWLNRNGEQYNCSESEPRVDHDYWCGDHPMFPRWIEQQKGK